MSGLLERVGVTDEFAFAPGRTNKGETYRKALDGAHRYRDVRIAGDGGQRRDAAAEEVIAIHQVGGPRRAHGGRDQDIEMILCERGIDALGAREPPGALMGLDIMRVAQVAPGIGLGEQLLPEIRHLGGGVLVVVADQLCESARDWRLTRGCR